MGMETIDFKTTKCRHYYKCIHYRRIKAIQAKDERAVITPDRCILCGHCLRICPQSTKTPKSDLNMARGLLCEDMCVVVFIAPSYTGLLKHKTIDQVRGTLLRLGFEDVRETSERAASVTAEYAKFLAEHKTGNIITTCCPSANDLMEIYYPQPILYLAPVVSPMIAHGKPLREELGRDVKVVFLGPCIARKKEALDLRHEGYIDAVLNFNGINEWLKEEDIVIEDCEDRPFTAFDPKVNRLYPMTNGAVNSVLAIEEKEDGYRKFYVRGEDNCIDLCKSTFRGEIKGHFIKINVCFGDCIKGPMVDEEFIFRFEVKLDMEGSICREPAEERQVEPVWENINFRKRSEGRSPRDSQPTEEQIWEILCMTNKPKPGGELNCGACGYPTCREKVIAIFQHKVEVSMYILFMHEKAESMANLVTETSSNIVLIVGDDIRIMECSDMGGKYFGRTRSQALQMYLYELIDPANSQWVLDTYQDIHGKRVDHPGYNLSMLQDIMYIEEEDTVLAIFINITCGEELAKEEYERKLETIDLAQKVIHKQITVAQEIAGLLGETTVEIKTILTKLCHSLLGDGSDAGYAGGELEREILGVQLGSGVVPLKGVITAGAPGQMSGARQIPGAGHMSGAGEQKKPTGYIHIGSVNSRDGKSGYVYLGDVDLRKPGGNGGK